MSIGRCLRRPAALTALLALTLAATQVWAQSSFFRELVLKPKATQADGVRMVSVLLGQREGNLGSDTQFLKAKSIMPSDWQPGEQNLLSKGYAAYLLVRALGVKGGAGARVMGWNKRRAFQELTYLQIMPGKGGEHAKLTGPEVITLLDRATAHRDRNRTSGKQEAAKSSGRPGGEGR